MPTLEENEAAASAVEPSPIVPSGSPSPKRTKLTPPDDDNDDDNDAPLPSSGATTAAAALQSPADANDHDDTATTTTPPPLSKRARKKLAKLAAWQLNKIDKRVRERAKYRQRRAEAVARGDPPTGPSRKALKHNTMAASPNRQRICVDLDFDALMIDKDVAKCAKQLLWVYTINRKATAPAQIYFTGLQEGGRVQLALDKNDGYRNWDINYRADAYDAVFERERIVYLTSDAEAVLGVLRAEDVYVIGGLVDHNHHKGLTLQRATERGLRTARLPLGEHVQLKTRTVLTIVHVFDILLRVSSGESWPDAILTVLPSRKGAVARGAAAAAVADDADADDVVEDAEDSSELIAGAPESAPPTAVAEVAVDVVNKDDGCL